MIFIILVLLIFILLAYNFYVHYGRNGRLINRIPGPSGYSIIGNILMFQGSFEKHWKLHVTLSGQYYPIFKVWLLFKPFVAIHHPDDMEIILGTMTHIEKSIVYNMFHPWLKTGLLTSGGTKWQLRRKLLTPAFHFAILKHFINILIKEGEDMANSLKNIESTIVKDLDSFVSEHTLNALCETAMGTSLQELGPFQQQYRNAVHQMSQILTYKIMRPWLHNDWIFSLTSKGRQQKRILKILHGFTQKIIAERKLYHEQINEGYLKSFDKDTLAEEDNSETITIKKKRLAMIDILIATSREGHLTDSDIQEEIDTFLFAGHDTTAMTMCFVLLLLAEHKDVQDHVREEINAVMHESGGKLSMQSLQNLLYLERCIKETLRLYPPVYFISRVTSEDVKLQSYLVPAGTVLYINIYGAHRDPNYWLNPEVFDPDRFLSEKIRNRHPYSYLPFSAGPRNCIGQRFALLKLKALIAPLIYKFYLEPVEYLKDISLKAEVLIRPSHPFRLKFVPIINACTDI
ncbi:hypothetical protein P5V15_014418 [Pogonomyrmex californicus]